MSTVRVVVADQTNKRYGEILGAEVTEVVWELNEPGSATFTCDPFTSGADKLLFGQKREIQIFDDTDLIWWGVPTGIDGDSNSVTIRCEGLLWYFRKRFVDRMSLLYTSIEQRTIAWNIVAYMQSEAYQANRNFNINSAVFSGTTHIRSRVYAREDHAVALDLLQEFPTLNDGFDFSIEYDITGQRLWTPWYPRKGSVKNNHTLSWGNAVAQVDPLTAVGPEALWKVTDYKPGLTPQWLKDSSGNSHHLRLGSTGRADVIEGALNLPAATSSYAVAATGETQTNQITNFGFETNTTNWSGLTNCSIARTTAAGTFRGGVAAAAVTATATGVTDLLSQQRIAVTPGQYVYEEAWIKAATTGRNHRVIIMWYNAADAYVSQTNGTIAADVNTGFTQYAVSGVAPANITGYRLVVENTDATTPAGEVHYVDDVVAYTLTGVDVTGDIEIIARASADKWSSGAEQALVSKWHTSASSWILTIQSSGVPMLYFRTVDGQSTVRNATATASLTTVGVDGAYLWVKVTRVAATGVATFYTSLDGVAWTQLGTPVTSTTGNLLVGPDLVALGAYNSGAVGPFGGKIQRAIVKNGIGGTTVFDADLSSLADGTPRFTEALGKQVIVKPDRAVVVGGVFHQNDTSQGCVTVNKNWGVTGDIDLRATVEHNNGWIALSGTADIPIAFDLAGARGAFLYLAAGGQLRLYWSADGTNLLNAEATVLPSTVLPASGAVELRATLDVDNGAAGRTVSFYWRLAGSSSWTSLGAAVTSAGVTSIFNGSRSIAVGSTSQSATVPYGTDPWNGKIYAASVRNGIDGSVVASVDFSLWSDGDGVDVPNYDSQGNPWRVVSDTTGVDTNDPTYLSYDGNKYAYAPGVGGNYLIVPDSTASRITGDITIDFQAAMDDWSPSFLQHMFNKYGSAGNLGWTVWIDTNQTVALRFSVDGTNIAGTYGSTAAIPAVDRQKLWIRASRVASTGIIKFFWSHDAVTWTQIGSDIGGATGNLFATTADINIGGSAAFGNSATAKIYRARLYNGAFNGTVQSGFLVLDVDTSKASEPYATFNANNYNYLNLPGITGNTPSLANLNTSGVTGLHLTAKVGLLDWTPGAQTALMHRSGDTYSFHVNTTGTLGVWWYDSGATFRGANSNVSVPVTDGQDYWVRVVVDTTANSVNFYTSPDGTTWTQLGTTVTVGAGLAIRNAVGGNMFLGSYNGTGNLMTGRYHRAIAYTNTTGTGTPLFNVDFNAVAAGATSFTDLSNNTWTINQSGGTPETVMTFGVVTVNRSTSGKKTAVVDRPMFLFGSDDYMEVADHAALDFDLADSGTFGGAIRRFAGTTLNDRLLSKSLTGSNLGYEVIIDRGVTGQMQATVGNGTTTVGGISAAQASGVAMLVAGVLNRTAQTLKTYSDATEISTASTSAIGSIATTAVLRVGGISNSTSRADMEFFGAIIVRRALSVQEISDVATALKVPGTLVVANVGGTRNIQKFNLSVDVNGITTHAYVTGGSSGDVKFENNYEDTLASSVSGVMQAVISEGSENDVNWLYERAQREVNTRKDPISVPSVTVFRYAGDKDYLKEVVDGDSIPVSIYIGIISYIKTPRIRQKRWTPKDDMIEFTFNEAS